MSEPRISVVIPVFDGERYLAEALDSILRQTVGRFQVIVVDDASPDDSVVVVERRRGRIEAAGHTLDVLRLDRNQGIGSARNVGIRHARHQFITFLDQDDTWPAERTAVLHAALHSQRAQIARGRVAIHDVMPGIHRSWVRPEWFEGTHPGNVLGATLSRADVFDQVGLLDPAMRSGFDDVDWFARLRLSRVRVHDVSAVVLERKIHDRNQSRLSAGKQSELLASVRAHLARQRGVGGARGVAPRSVPGSQRTGKITFRMDGDPA